MLFFSDLQKFSVWSALPWASRNVWRLFWLTKDPWLLAPSGAGMLTLYFGRQSCIMKNYPDQKAQWHLYQEI